MSEPKLNLMWDQRHLQPWTHVYNWHMANRQVLGEVALVDLQVNCVEISDILKVSYH